VGLTDVFGLTEPHLGEPDKPNEDAWVSRQSQDNLDVMVVADGITRTRLSDGSYPEANGAIASESFVKSVVKNLRTQGLTAESVREAVSEANKTIAEENKKAGLTRHTVDYQSRDYLGTTGCILGLQVDGKKHKAVFAYLGDVIAIYLPESGAPKLLTRDQLHGCHQFSYNHFSKAQKAERLLWQRKEARNRRHAQDPHGNLVGFGAFTGEPEALDFLEVVELEVQPGDRFILSTDALRIAANIGHKIHFRRLFSEDIFQFFFTWSDSRS